MKILLFGGSSRLGSAFRRLLTSKEIDAPTRDEVDPSDAVAVASRIDALGPDVIVNCIANNAVDAAETTGRDEAFRLNAELPKALADEAGSRSIPFIHFSTDYVFGGSKVEGYAEDDAADAGSVYGTSKAAGEEAVRRAHPGSYVIRTSRLYGPPATSTNAKKSFVELIIDDGAKSARVMVNPEERSAPTFVDDLVRHVETHILNGRPEPGIYHASNDGGATWLEWAREIGLLLKMPVKFVPRDPATLVRPATRPQHSILRSTKLPSMRPWREALRDMIESSGLSFTPQWQDVGIEGAAIEKMPRIGDKFGAVLHMLPGGILNPHGFGTDLKDIYAFTAKGKNTFRGGHYHLKLDELFFQFSGTAFWVLSDFRETSPTFGKTVSVEIDVEKWIIDGSFPRIRVPAGVYHAIFPLTDERVMSVGIGSTPYDKEDYRYPTPDEVPGMRELVATCGIFLPPV